MARPSSLTHEQWAEVERRKLAGETVRSLSAAFGISPGQISKRFPNKGNETVKEVAQQLAAAQTALAALPLHQQHTALSLVDSLRNISTSLAAGAELGAKTAHRLQALANSEIGKVDDADPLDSSSIEKLKGVSALTRLANDASAMGLNLLGANRETVKRLNEEGSPSEGGTAPTFNVTMRTG